MSAFETITELPGNNAHKDQIDAMRTRYSWAAEYINNNKVLTIEKLKII